MREIRTIEPQPGYQMDALSSPADIVIGGGAAGVGKTFTLLLDPIRHLEKKGFGGVIFRRTTTQIRNEGGLWDTSMGIYHHLNGEPKESYLEWVFPGGQKLKFSHLEHEKNIYDWQGSQIPFLGFDELTHFSETMFFYLLSRNRSTCGVRPYVRATCNPDPESWVARLIEWWIDQETGLPIPERNGVVRYFCKDGDTYIWGSSVDEVIEKAWYFLKPVTEASGTDAKNYVKSITFISGSIYGNKKLLEVDPGYLANLMAQDEQTKNQLLHGNWKMVISDNDIYDYYAFLGAFDNLYEVDRKKKRIIADIALKGSNKLIIGYWEGDCLEDLVLMNKSDGKQVVSAISSMAKKYGVANMDIVFDGDGVGGFVDGFISGAVSFNGGLPPVLIKDPITGKAMKENYFNLKAQCFYRSGQRVADGRMKISERVANMMYDDKMTVRQRMFHERKAIKRDKADKDGKLCVIPKDKMKAMLGGESPDLMDMLMMREYPELRPSPTWLVK